eukprot:m.169127 g.169127  ORF g.169127 m.169127 type:complete len:98 (-) comp53218_c0_seq1:131-424(-)
MRFSLLLQLVNRLPHRSNSGDRCAGGNRAGCVDLLREIQTRVHPKYHVFGHIHEGYGLTTDGQTTFVNASTCTYHYKPTQPAIVFDLPIGSVAQVSE